jgi:hypothetical protein
MAINPSLAKQEAAMAARGGIQPVIQKKTGSNKPPAGGKTGGDKPPTGDKTTGDKTTGDTPTDDKTTGDTSTIDALNARLKELEAEIAKGKTESEKDALRLKQERELAAAEKKEKAQSIYDTVSSELTRLGLSSLVDPLKKLFESGITDGESLRLALSQTEQYQTRFSANAKRIAAGLSALSPAEYIQLEDQYQNVMRNYGLPATYYTKDPTGKQIGFEELLGGDVSATELEERLIAGQERVLKSNPEVLDALKDFYPDIKNGNILAYALDPKNALKDIQRKVAAAEIGGAALAQKLATSAAGAEELLGYGVTKAQAQQGFADVAQMAPRGGVLANIYNESPYNQATATAEVFGTAGAADATQKRKKLTSLEQATFGGQSGLSQGALARNSGAGAF